MRHASIAGAGQTPTINQRGVIEFIGYQRGLPPQQSPNDAQIGRPTRGEQQRALTAGVFGQRLLQLLMHAVVARHQGGRARTTAQPRHRLTRRSGQTRVRSQTQIIIAAKIDAAPAIHSDIHTVRAIEHPPGAVEVLLAQAFALGFQKLIEMHGESGGKWGAQALLCRRAASIPERRHGARRCPQRA